MKTLLLSLLISLALIGCSNKKAKIPSKSPCACYDIIIDMSQKG